MRSIAALPTPSPSPSVDADLITPGVLGFLAILFVTAVTVLLIIDMNRRVRRVRYRGELRERLQQADGTQRPGRPEPGDRAQPGGRSGSGGPGRGPTGKDRRPGR